MAITKLLTLLLSLCFALAEDSTAVSSSGSNSGMSGFPSFPSIPGMPNFSSIFPSIPGMPSMGSGFASFPGMPNMPGMSNMFGSRSSWEVRPDDSGNHHNEQHDGEGHERHEGQEGRGVDGLSGEHDPEHEHQDRFFFTHFPVITGCNYTDHPGRSCRSCNQALTCTANNVGLLQTCHGLFRYCNNGRCSFSRGPACDATTTTSTSTTSTTSTSTSTSTSTPTSTTSTNTPAAG